MGEWKMKRLTWNLGIVAIACVATAVAQPPGGEPGGRGGGPGGGRPPMPVIEVLDADHDHVISADELKNSTASLLTLDKNKDGKLTEDEFGPQAGGTGGTGAGRGQGGPAGGGRAGGGAGQRPQSGRQEGNGGPEGPSGRGPGGRRGDGPNEGPPRPNPERMVEHAMEFDADKDGKLSHDELAKFAEEFAKRHAGPPQCGEPGGPGGSGPNESNRSERPRRPE